MDIVCFDKMVVFSFGHFDNPAPDRPLYKI